MFQKLSQLIMEKITAKIVTRVNDVKFKPTKFNINMIYLYIIYFYILSYGSPYNPVNQRICCDPVLKSFHQNFLPSLEVKYVILVAIYDIWCPRVLCSWFHHPSSRKQLKRLQLQPTSPESTWKLIGLYTGLKITQQTHSMHKNGRPVQYFSHLFLKLN